MSNTNQAAWLLYGATGYTGRLIAEEAARRGLRPVLAGRDEAKVAALGEQLDLPTRVFALDDAAAVDAGLAGMRAVLHCAGPFSRTARPMIEGCLRTGCQYLDITGEIDVIEYAAGQMDRAKQAGITVMPAVGFDVVPSDCLARSLSEALEGATHLALAFTVLEGVSPGTAKTMLESFPQGGKARVDGKIVTVPPAWHERDVSMAGRTYRAVSIPWGDVASAYYTTRIPNIETFIALPRKMAGVMRGGRWMAPLVRVGVVRRSIEWLIDRLVAGPNATQRERSRSHFWGEVRDPAGHTVTGTLETPGGYALTVLTALAVVERVVRGEVPAGFTTPAGALGKDFILQIPGTAMRIGT
ncbi:MAG TPA: saccharopine dehydrogenase NADP-binding domain-containing protein [Pirellulales bacterium]|nr:saccharopine dehydrogenase NADP-binding domain-containing protein [Pirellulales bacterium]